MAGVTGREFEPTLIEYTGRQTMYLPCNIQSKLLFVFFKVIIEANSRKK